jgi:hypothetical protein
MGIITNRSPWRKPSLREAIMALKGPRHDPFALRHFQVRRERRRQAVLRALLRAVPASPTRH